MLNNFITNMQGGPCGNQNPVPMAGWLILPEARKIIFDLSTHKKKYILLTRNMEYSTQL